MMQIGKFYKGECVSNDEPFVTGRKYIITKNKESGSYVDVFCPENKFYREKNGGWNEGWHGDRFVNIQELNVEFV